MAAEPSDAPITSPASDDDDDVLAERMYQQLVELHPVETGKHASKGERKQKRLYDSTLVYGEIMFSAFAKTIRKARLAIKEEFGGLLEPGGTFVDIGSGTGKPVFAACLLHDFDRCVGIEILESLHTIALELHQRWQSVVAPSLPEPKRRTELQFLCSDAFAEDWSGAVLLFANSTCFSDEMMEMIADKAAEIPSNPWVISFTRPLPDEHFEVVDAERHDMTWGEATVFIHRRK